jgi:hypothetical protein
MKNIITHLLAAVGAFAIAVGLMQGIYKNLFHLPTHLMKWVCVLLC